MGKIKNLMIWEEISIFVGVCVGWRLVVLLLDESGYFFELYGDLVYG